ncbi:MAG TPA: Fe-S cluster assembly ATPase SufC [Acidimicrobiaceae bacterium]|nr:Fe-S cluster assembly ATPase SufC [Acidimicrobiaceae bacterium]
MATARDTAGETPLFEIDALEVSAVDGPQILRGVSLALAPGECHAVMGPNGSGKTTLASVILGSPEFKVDSGALRLRGDDIADWDTDVRARAGLFLAFQYPESITGVSIRNFLRQAVSARRGTDVSVIEVYVAMQDWMSRLEIDPEFMDRSLNEGFSGGEKKRNEILQMALLEPEVAVLDETDSGLDIDALKVVASGVQQVRAEHHEMGVLVITHYQRLLEELQPDAVHVMVDGAIVRSGGMELAHALDADGYEQFEQ